MAKKNKSKSPKSQEAKKTRITMKDLEEMSDSDDEQLPPESEWTPEAKALKATIETGAFDHLLDKRGDDSDESVEEEDVDDESESEASSEDEDGTPEEPGARDEADDPIDEKPAAETTLVAEESDDDSEATDSSDNDAEPGRSHETSAQPSSAKALAVVTEEVAASKKAWPWAETFDIVSATPLPFGHDETSVNIHDDLKREVAFYDMALEAVQEARTKCQQAKIPFARPEDFFAEMVKTDEHMAKVKDRLIFENKKIEAVAQRKSNKEQKLRSKETHANKLAEKAKRKREHFEAVDEWAQAAAKNRGQRLGDDDADMLNAMGRNKGPNKKRLAADRKFGFGGKRGLFKQNDPKTLNDTSGFKSKGNSFAGGMKKTSSGGKRQGKRARDAKRSKR